MKTIKYVTIKGREYRAITTSYGGGTLTSTRVQVLVIFAEDNGSQWRALPWFAAAKIEEVLKLTQ